MRLCPFTKKKKNKYINLKNSQLLPLSEVENMLRNSENLFS